MKKTISILLIIIIISPLWIFYSVVQYQKYFTKKEIKKFLISNININELVLFKFTTDEAKSKLKWEHSKEFEYNGEMYDVVEKNIVGDSVYYWCWWDHEETKLNKRLNLLVEHASKNNNQDRERAQRLSNIFSSFFTENLSYKYFKTDYKKTTYPQSNNKFYSSLSIIPDTPPPKI